MMSETLGTVDPPRPRVDYEKEYPLTVTEISPNVYGIEKHYPGTIKMDDGTSNVGTSVEKLRRLLTYIRLHYVDLKDTLGMLRFHNPETGEFMFTLFDRKFTKEDYLAQNALVKHTINQYY